MLQSFALDMLSSNIAISCYNEQESLKHNLAGLFFSRSWAGMEYKIHMLDS